MANPYKNTLNATKLHEVYQTEIGRVNQYLKEEIKFVRNRLQPGDSILEIGAGYGRIMRQLAASIKFVYGFDISDNSIRFGQEYLKDCPNCELIVADAYEFDNKAAEYDAVLCLQNGLSAIRGNPGKLVASALKMLKDSGTAYFSSYSPKFWDVRLAWFREQADKGLIGEIDYEKTKDGCIICKDGFTATTFSASDLERLGKASGHKYTVQEVDESSLFLIIQK